MVGLFGKDAVDGPAQAKMQAVNLQNMSEVGCPFIRGLQSEKNLQSLLKGTRKTLTDLGQLDLGLDDLLPALARSHDSHLYLLQQRMAQRKAQTVRFPRDPVHALTARYLLRLASRAALRRP